MTDRPNRAPTYPLRLLASIKREAERLTATYGVSLNQFVTFAVAEKVGAMWTAAYFVERRAVADWAAFDRLIERADGLLAREGMRFPLI